MKTASYLACAFLTLVSVIYFVYLAIGAWIFVYLERAKEIERCDFVKAFNEEYMREAEKYVWKK